MFKTAVIEGDLSSYEKRVKCSSCWKSFFLHRAAWRIVGRNTVEVVVVLAGQVKDSFTRRKARSKWSKKAHGEMVKRVKAKSATSDLEVRKLPVLKARSEVSKGE